MPILIKAQTSIKSESYGLTRGSNFNTIFAACPQFEGVRGRRSVACSCSAFANSELDERKKIFARQLLNYVPLASHIRRVLDERPSHTARKSRFFDELEDYMTEELAEQTMRTVISWGRYAEVFAYDDHRQVFSLENPA